MKRPIPRPRLIIAKVVVFVYWSLTGLLVLASSWRYGRDDTIWFYISLAVVVLIPLALALWGHKYFVGRFILRCAAVAQCFVTLSAFLSPPPDPFFFMVIPLIWLIAIAHTDCIAQGRGKSA